MGLGSWSSIVGNVLLFFLVLGLAVTVEFDEFKRSLRSKGLLIGVFAQFVFLPLCSFVIARTLLTDKPVLGIPLIVTASSPGGSYSNWWTSLFNGDLSLSVAMTTVSSILSIGFLPLNLFIYIEGAYPNGTAIKMKWGGLFVAISLVIVGIVLGIFLGARVPKVKKVLNIGGNICGALLVLLGFFFSSNSSSPIWSRGWKFYVGLTVPCVMGLVISLGFARLARLEMPQALAVAIEVCYQNTAIALAVILSSFEDDPSCRTRGQATCDIVGEATGVPTFYQLVQVVSLGILCLIAWHRGWSYAPKGTSLYAAITKDFQPHHGDTIEVIQENGAPERDMEQIGEANL
tara:strand:+ start:95 stop:1132 length:1038 start_codon:yes stop_codon:yes gene_type:complete